MSDESIKTKPVERITGTDELSTSKNGKRTNLEAGTFLKNKHPELFQFLPRPGGFYRHLAARQNASRTVVDSSTSRNKPTNLLSAPTNFSIGSHTNMNKILETNIRCPSARTHISKTDQKNDTVRVCSIVISTVMMLAQKTYEDITAEHIRHSEEYFRGLRQHDGYPQNVGQLLQLLTNLKINGKIVSPVIQEDDDYVDKEEEEPDDRGNIPATIMIPGNAVKKEKKVSIASNNFFDIQPVAYSFRVPKQGPASGSIMTAMQPPQWLYHDHALGVIWMLFHKDKNYIGISQLHWCLRFLLDLKNSQGEYTGDVDICIQAIQDDLIEQYSKCGTVLEKAVGEKYSGRMKLSKVPDEAIDTILNAERVERTEPVVRDSIRNESVIIQQDNESTNPHKFDPNATNTNQKGFIEENFSPMQSQKIKGASTPSEEEARTLKLEDKNEHSQDSEEHCSHRCAASSKRMKKEEIMSFTYKEMIARGATLCTDEYFIEHMHDNSPFIDQSMEKTANEIIPDGDLTGQTLADMDTRELANFLNSSRTQHLERIRKEIERLYGLEKFMENINASGFSAYITEDLARRVENLRDEDVVKVAKEIIK